MGLDGVELVMRWEADFGVEIPDEVASRLVTPKHAIDYIYAQLPHASDTVCLDQRAFYIVRRALVDLFEVERGVVNPETDIAVVIGDYRRRRTWQDLRTVTGLEPWPRLQRPQWVIRSITGTAVLAGGTALVVSGFSALTGALALAATGYVGYLATTVLASEVPCAFR